MVPVIDSVDKILGVRSGAENEISCFPSDKLRQAPAGPDRVITVDPLWRFAIQPLHGR